MVSCYGYLIVASFALFWGTILFTISEVHLKTNKIHLAKFDTFILIVVAHSSKSLKPPRWFILFVGVVGASENF